MSIINSIKVWSYEVIAAAKPSAYLVKHILRENSLAAICGAPGKGKSFIAIAIMMAVNFGLQFAGKKTTKGLCVYLAGEGHYGLVKRIQGWLKYFGIVGSPTNFGCVPVAFDITDPSNYGKLIQELRNVEKLTGESIVLIVLDTLARFNFGDENSAKDISRLVAVLDLLRQTFNCCVLVVHHTGKNPANGMRGSSALLGAMDTVFEVRRTKFGFEMECTKQKDDEDGQVYHFKAERVSLGHDEDGEEITTLVPVYQTTVSSQGSSASNDNMPTALQPGAFARVFLNILRAAGPQGLTRDAWRKACRQEAPEHMDRSSNFADAIKFLIKERLIKKEGDRFIAKDNDDDDFGGLLVNQ